MNIAIWGLGVSGLSSLRFLAQKTQHKLYIINQGDVSSWITDEILTYVSQEACLSQDNALELTGMLDLIVLSPGIDPRQEIFQNFLEVETICEVELAFRYLKKDAKYIALTGTNGKTTTVTLITKALEAAGKNVFLGGNIGTPLCEALLLDEEFDFYVLELSSFQISLLKDFHPQIAIVLNITKSHMERYDSIQEYIDAKLALGNNLTTNDLWIAPSEYINTSSSATKKEIQMISGYSFEHSILVGNHYKLNFFVVEQVLNFFDLDSQKIIQNLINTFSGVKYRLEYLGEFKGAKIYNDAKSTNTSSTYSAISAFKDKKVACLLGGKLRDLSQNLKELECDDVDFYGFGEAKDFISTQLKCIIADTLSSLILELDFEKYDVVVFSPAFPSFDQYKNYVERGKDFENLIQKLI